MSYKTSSTGAVLGCGIDLQAERALGALASLSFAIYALCS
jgi:hypothetical protein